MLLIAVGGRLNFPRRTIDGLPAAENVESLTLEVLKARSIRKSCQMARGEDRFGEEDVAKLCCLFLLNGNRISQQRFMPGDLAQ